MILTDAQQRVVDVDGDFLLLACPGSGKTRAAAARVMRLASSGGHSVAACSYTNVGAERIAALLDQPLHPKHFLGTVHAFLLRFVVYPFAHLAGAKRGPQLRQQGWPTVMVHRDPRQRVELDAFSYTPDGELVLREKPRSVRGTSEEILASVGAEVRARKDGFFTHAGMLSSDDAMFRALTLLREHPTLAEAVGRRFSELLIDEAQDTSELQLACVHELKQAGGLRSLVLIGDLEQSIFSFQGASAAGCRSLASTHGLAQMPLSENHRCSQKICDAAAHFCARGQPDAAVGDTRDCPIDPEVALYPASDPQQAMDIFRARLQEHRIATGDCAVLARRRTMVEALAGAAVKIELQERPQRIAQIAIALADGTLTRSDVRYLERTLVRCAYGEQTMLEQLQDEQREQVRGATNTFIAGLPALSGDLRAWIGGAKDALALAAGMLVEKPATAAGMLLKSKADHQLVSVAEVFRPPPRDLLPQTVHSIKGEDREAIMMVVRKPHGADPTKQFELFDAVASGADVGEEAHEERRVTFVAITRARRYCLVALPDTPRGRGVADACSALGFAHV